MYYVYILQCADKTLYTGITTNLARRITEHNQSSLGAKYTHARRPVTLIYSHKYTNRSLASKEESRIKKLNRNEKLLLASTMNSKEESLKELRAIPGIRKSIAVDLYDIGIRKISDLKNKNPEKLFIESNNIAGGIQDKCLLYTFRCAVYFASHKTHKPVLLKWWNWQDKKKKR